MDISKALLMTWGYNIVYALLILIIGVFVVKTLVRIIRKIFAKAGTDEILANFITSIIRAILYLFVFVAALDRLGVNTSSLIALIGAAGLAVGLALQNSLQNFAAGVMLILFKPFGSGDFVECAGTAGIIEKISIFSTTMRTGDNREVIVPNGSIYKSNITNFSARDTRRIDMVFGIGYDDDIKKAKDLIWEVLNSDERILKDPAPTVAVGELGASSVDFVVRPWVNSGDYWAVKFDMNEKIKNTFDENGINIPYPQMDIHLDKKD